jgi:post-segregation antitoxin (ccd killing protein)
MRAPVSVRLDDDVQQTLEAEARARGIGLSAYLHEVATAEARRVRRERIRRQSRAVGEHAAREPRARGFFEDWGSGPDVR